MRFLSALSILFIALKLCEIIDWSWWLVLAPLYLPWAIVVVPPLIIAVTAFVLSFLPEKDKNDLDIDNHTM